MIPILWCIRSPNSIKFILLVVHLSLIPVLAIFVAETTSLHIGAVNRSMCQYHSSGDIRKKQRSVSGRVGPKHLVTKYPICANYSTSSVGWEPRGSDRTTLPQPYRCRHNSDIWSYRPFLHTSTHIIPADSGERLTQNPVLRLRPPRTGFRNKPAPSKQLIALIYCLLPNPPNRLVSHSLGPPK